MQHEHTMHARKLMYMVHVRPPHLPWTQEEGPAAKRQKTDGWAEVSAAAAVQAADNQDDLQWEDAGNAPTGGQQPTSTQPPQQQDMDDDLAWEEA